MHTLRKPTLTLIAFAALVLATAPAAHAEEPDPLQVVDATGIAGSAGLSASPVDEPESPELLAYLDTLSESDRLTFVRTRLPAEQVIARSAPLPIDAAAQRSARLAADTGSAVSPMSTGCWTQRWNGSARSAAGNVLYTYYTSGGWCSTGSTVTRAWLAEAGGETSTPGWRYDGVVKSGAGVVSNQGRSYAQHRFVLRVGGWDVQSPSPCLRVSGTSGGTSSGAYTCGIS
ncbi:hypothetical protein [Cellulomonas sp. KRMCY2]|uniref:hypothetical protein n=1 Tax=Cellulomonas sp. KRMCY2 TaxID=1304865 RepID=UPI00045E79EE|nr:hypothetical protein [Cellulomonas sp. KRMCY2]